MRRKIISAAMAFGLATGLACASPVASPSQGVLVLYEDVPQNVWDGLLALGYRGSRSDDCECLYIPEGTEAGRYDPANGSTPWVITLNGPEPLSWN